jgi:hypothetical protein
VDSNQYLIFELPILWICFRKNPKIIDSYRFGSGSIQMTRICFAFQ